MNLKSKLNPLNILLAVSLFATAANTLVLVEYLTKPTKDISAISVKVDILESQMKDRPTYEKVDLMMDERSQYQEEPISEYHNENEFEDKRLGIDLSKPAKDEITYKIKATGKVVVAGDETCEADKNRLHWELFMMPAPGCENTPHKGL